MVILYTVFNQKREAIFQTWDSCTATLYAMEHPEQDARYAYEYTSNIPEGSKIAFIANEQAMSDYHRTLQARIFVPKGRR
jgi:hypothetical protein